MSALAELAQVLAVLDRDVHQVYAHPSALPQADQLAARHGFTVSCEPWDEAPDEWMLFTFTPSSTELA